MKRERERERERERDYESTFKSREIEGRSVFGIRVVLRKWYTKMRDSLFLYLQISVFERMPRNEQRPIVVLWKLVQHKY